MSFTEIIHWGVLAIALVVGSAYAYAVQEATTLEDVQGALLLGIVVLVVSIVVFALAVAVPMAIRSKGNLSDERDDAAEAGAVPWAFSVVVIGATWAVTDILTRDAPDEIRTVNILLGSIFAAACVGSIVTLARYRLGIR